MTKHIYVKIKSTIKLLKKTNYNGILKSHIYKFQERYEQINDEVRLMSDRMDELRSALNQTRDPGMAHAIGQQMEMLQDKQARLLHEQQEHSRALQRYSNTR